MQHWLDQGAMSGEYPPMRGVGQGTRVLDQITVIIGPD